MSKTKVTFEYGLRWPNGWVQKVDSKDEALDALEATPNLIMVMRKKTVIKEAWTL